MLASTSTWNMLSGHLRAAHYIPSTYASSIQLQSTSECSIYRTFNICEQPVTINISGKYITINCRYQHIMYYQVLQAAHCNYCNIFEPLITLQTHLQAEFNINIWVQNISSGMSSGSILRSTCIQATSQVANLPQFQHIQFNLHRN